jgi:hypothetical protein
VGEIEHFTIIDRQGKKIGDLTLQVSAVQTFEKAPGRWVLRPLTDADDQIYAFAIRHSTDPDLAP